MSKNSNEPVVSTSGSSSQKIPILHIIKSLGRGGAEMLLPETLKMHDKRDFSFHYIYFLPWKDQMVESLKNAGGRVTCLPASNNIALMLQVNQVVAYVKRHGIKLIHAHLPWAGIVARIAGKLSRTPVIYTEHNKQERYHFITRLVNLSTLNMLDSIVAVSSDVEESIRRNKPRLSAPLQVILNGVNTAHFKSDKHSGYTIKSSLGIPENSPVIGTVAVFRSQKRLDAWLENAKQINKRRPDVRFVIVGDGPLKEQLRIRARDLQISEIIHFVGLQEDVRPYLAVFDVYMMSSIFEGLPIALLEAMASGCPVVSTAAGGIKEVITHGVNGLLCNVEQPNQLANLAISLLENPEQRTRIASEGMKTIDESFSIAKMVKEIETLYHTKMHQGH